ncbi:FHA domain-containing protein [Salinibacterium sp. dk2585]|uniref:FHA domain-containing protein n=1 Tax=unclassified Salinibacterium TaxID=2632331 RepID=UPI0011C250EC|nr:MULTISPECIES: FHA domain-containing protein [unclassified Salinibacterium]QEE60944.1 FHA domain-containing protein [Salinibacterium sp. dk2585]TXK56015.1 FHA domain-containing protein [Salinibacterium sp. dk5596]
MASEHDEPAVAPPPPGAPEAVTPTPTPAAPVTNESDFISLPPGMADFDSGTYRIQARRPEPPVAERPPVFVPTIVPGLPVTPLTAVTAEPVDEVTRVTAAPLDDATRVVQSRRAAWTLTLPAGESRELRAGVLLLGRGPAASAAWPGAGVLPLDDPRKSVSKTHAALELDGAGTLKVHDLDSTNGVWLSYANGDEVDVVPGSPGIVEDGAVLHLGEFGIRLQRR